MLPGTENDPPRAAVHKHVRLASHAVDADPPVVHHDRLARQADHTFQDAAAELDGAEHDNVTASNSVRLAKLPREQGGFPAGGSVPSTRTRPGSATPRRWPPGRHSSGHHCDETWGSEVDHDSIVVAAATPGKREGARLVPVAVVIVVESGVVVPELESRVVVVVLLALGVLDEAHRTPRPSGDPPRRP